MIGRSHRASEGIVRAGVVSLLLATLAGPGGAAEPGPGGVGQIKIATGAAHVERAGTTVPATVGTWVRAADVVITGADGTVGITFLDASRLSIGPGSVLALDRFAFDPTTHQGAFESSLRKGTLAAVSGQIAKQTPDAMKVRTPVAILGVRGTEFVVRTAGTD